jgi:hypothetical protein
VSIFLFSLAFDLTALSRFLPPIRDNRLLIKVLELSEYLMSPTIRQCALRDIDTRKWNFEPGDLIEICFKYSTKQFFVHAFLRLAELETKLYDLSNDDLHKITFQVFFVFVLFLFLNPHSLFWLCPPRYL